MPFIKECCSCNQVMESVTWNFFIAALHPSKVKILLFLFHTKYMITVRLGFRLHRLKFSWCIDICKVSITYIYCTVLEKLPKPIQKFTSRLLQYKGPAIKYVTSEKMDLCSNRNSYTYNIGSQPILCDKMGGMVRKMIIFVSHCLWKTS